MRTKEDITDLITEIDNGIGTDKDKEELEYLGSVKAILQWVLKKISTVKKNTKIEENLREIYERTLPDELSEDDYDFLNKKFEGEFKDREPYSFFCSVADTLGWVLEDNTSTKHFLSDCYLNLK